MPELPEVETVVRGLREQIIGKKIATVQVKFAKMVKVDPDVFQTTIVNQTITTIERFGKYILIVLSNDKIIRIHLRMEGKFFLTTEAADETLDKHVHVILEFTDQTYLKYHDVRKFGTFELIERQTDWHQDTKFAELGYEPWEAAFTTGFLYQRLKKSNMMIKPFLLDQKTIVGLGNIYVDEVLFLAKIHPESTAKALSKQDAEHIRNASITVLEKAIKLGGSTIRTYHNTLGIDGLFQNELHVHLQKDKPCPICGTTIIKIKVGGRGTYLCPHCQKLKKVKKK